MFGISKQLIRIAISIEKQQKLQNMILNNEKLKEQKELTIKQLCKILNISKNYYHENSKYIKPLLDKIQVNIVDSRKFNVDTLQNKIQHNQALTDNTIISIQHLLKSLGIGYNTYKKHQKTIEKLLENRNIKMFEQKYDLQQLIKKNQIPNLVYPDELRKILNISYGFFKKNKNKIKQLLEQKNIFLCQNKIEEIKFLINKIPNNSNFYSSKELCKQINLQPSNFTRYKKIILKLLKEKNIQLKQHRQINLETIILNNKQLNNYSSIGVKSLSNILNVSESYIRNNIEVIIHFLNIRKIRFLPENQTDIYDKIINNEKLKNNIDISIKQLCELCKLSQSAFYNHYNEILNLLHYKNIRLRQKKKNYQDMIKNNSQLKNNEQITVTDLCNLLKITKQSYFLYKDQITESLNKRNITVVKTISKLQKNFEETVLKLNNVKVIKKQVVVDCAKQINICFKKCIKKATDILNKSENKTIISNRIKSSNTINNKTRLNNLLNYLNKYLTNLNKAPFDFYIETINGSKYLIECQGEQHYNERHNLGDFVNRIIIDASKMLITYKYNCNFIATYDVKTKKNIKESLDVFNDFYMTTEEAIQLIKNDGTVDKHKIKRCAITMINRIRKKFEDRIDQLSKKIKGQQKTNKEILEQIRKY